MNIKLLLLLVISAVMVNTGCEKAPVDRRPPQIPNTGNPSNPGDTSNSTPDTTVTVPVNTPPHGNAGPDRLVEISINETFVGGSYYDLENNIVAFDWTKLSGPDSYNLENKNAGGTKLSGMEKGVYQFQFTITDAEGFFDRDTMMVVVGEMSTDPKEKLFADLNWGTEGPVASLLWGSIVGIQNVYSYLPVGSLFRVYIRSTNVPDWTELKQLDQTDNYSFYLMNGNLYVYSHADQSGTASIKVTY